MAEFLQPALFDRLERPELIGRRGFSVDRLREAVKRDLAWLFNTTHLAASQDLSEYPYVEQSVLNYGLPDLSGKTVAGIDDKELERLIRLAIRNFEPRLLSESIRVRALPPGEKVAHNILKFEIEADLWGEPIPLHVLLKTEIDLDIGDVKVTEGGAG
jgi:type VI secretion system protein ImpF